MNSRSIQLPIWIVVWLIMSAVIVLWDVMFVLLRPASFANGSLGRFWQPYAKYITIDTSYADLQNTFVIAQSYMSLFEISLSLVAVYLYFNRKHLEAFLFAFASLLLTGAKTMLIFILEITDKGKHVLHNSFFDLITLYILPNTIWIIIPFIAVTCLSRKLIRQFP